jgi:exonuclease VII small subunit
MDEGLLRTLALTPPDEFVAARNQLAKRLKADGDAESARVVAALRRGSWTDWSLNTVADSDPQLVQRYVDAAADVRKLQSGGKGDLRQALHDLRQLTSELTRAAATHLSSRNHAPALLELAERLSLVGGSEQASARLISATLAADVEDEEADTPAPDGDDEDADDEDADDAPYVPSARTRRPPARRQPRPKSTSEPRAKPADEVGRRRVERAAREAQESLDESTSQLVEAEAQLEHAVDEVERATAAVAEANAALNAARRRQIEAKRARDAVKRDVVVATKALERATAALVQHG